MCRPNYERSSFFEKGAAKGWSVDRVQKAWDALGHQRAREDARAIMAAPPPPKALAVGDRVKLRRPASYQAKEAATILHVEPDGFLIKWPDGSKGFHELEKWERADD
jgi:hypothetical protein